MPRVTLRLISRLLNPVGCESMSFDARRGNLRKALKKAGPKALLVTNYTNVSYLTGFTGDDSY
ncbi:MAG TPA: aminopeptidase P family N-terminal domain-containing protein, partial [Pirellulales bacterium]|nr:aminopeptidase P family N-terminal domain-containing protein [Pirellulales bacterium]